MILEPFYPKEWVDSTYEIDWEGWREKGKKGVIFDIDNTLVPHGAPADERALALFKQLHGLGFQTILLSNNKEPRVKNYNRAMEQMGLTKEEVLFVGDQLFTDVYGANRAGIYGILVKPINPKEEIQIVLKRYLETVVLHFYKRELKNRK